MRIIGKALLISLCTATSIGPFTVSAVPRQDSGAALDFAIKQLWSDNRHERQMAKDELRRGGVDSIPPLIVLLKEFAMTPLSTFPTRQEKQMNRYLENRRSGDGAADAAQTNMAEVENVAARVKQDAIDLLGDLRAKEAVSVLIDLMWEEFDIPRLGKRPTFPEVDALLKIGSSAIPMLVESIKTADVTAKSVEIIFTQHPSERLKQRLVDSVRHKIQARSLIVLGHLGDAQVLPFLEDLRQTTSDDLLVVLISEVIEQIYNTK